MNQGQKYRILIVDDNIAFCKNVADILETKNYEVTIAEEGRQALQLLANKEYDVLLADIRLPDMTGVEILKKVKAMKPSVPVIMMTAYTVETLIWEALREGAFGYLKKPIDFNKLFNILEQSRRAGDLVLIVTEEEIFSNNAREILENRRFWVEVAGTGQRALELVREHYFDIILLDINPDASNGLEPCRAIRDIRPNTEVIMITGSVDKSLRESAYTRIEKPLDMDILVSMLDPIRDRIRKGIVEKNKGRSA